MQELKPLLERAKSSLGYKEINNPDGTVRAIHRQPAMALAYVSLTGEPVPVNTQNVLNSLRSMQVLQNLPLPPNAAARDIALNLAGQMRQGSPVDQAQRFLPTGTDAGKVTTLDGAIFSASRVAQAGATLIFLKDETVPIKADNGYVARTKIPKSYATLDPAEFSAVADGAEVAVSPLPVHFADVDLQTMPNYGMRFEISRAEQKLHGDQLNDLISASIAAGIANVADRVLLEAIAAATPAAFTYAAAAAAGVSFGELRALVGPTAADSGLEYKDGQLRLHGIPAELAQHAPESVVGAFGRCAVAIGDEIKLFADRIDTHGRLALTCWVSLQALIPKPEVFWKQGGTP